MNGDVFVTDIILFISDNNVYKIPGPGLWLFLFSDGYKR